MLWLFPPLSCTLGFRNWCWRQTRWHVYLTKPLALSTSFFYLMIYGYSKFIQGFDVLPSFHSTLLLQNNCQNANSNSKGKWQKSCKAMDNFVLNYQYQASKMSVLKMPPNEDATLNQDTLWSTWHIEIISKFWIIWQKVDRKILMYA